MGGIINILSIVVSVVGIIVTLCASRYSAKQALKAKEYCAKTLTVINDVDFIHYCEDYHNIITNFLSKVNSMHVRGTNMETELELVKKTIIDLNKYLSYISDENRSEISKLSDFLSSRLVNYDIAQRTFNLQDYMLMVDRKLQNEKSKCKKDLFGSNIR